MTDARLMILAVHSNLGMADRIAGFVDDPAGEHGRRSDAENQVLGIEAGAGYKRRRKLVVLVIGTCDEPPFFGLQRVFACMNLEPKTAVFGGEHRLDALLIRGVSDEDTGPSQRMSAYRAYHRSGNPETGG